MTEIRVRASASGKVIRPLPADGLFSWDASAPLVETLAAAGHPAGLYNLMLNGFVRAASAAGSVTLTIGWDQPRFGPTTLAVGLPANWLIQTGANRYTTAYRIINSSGLAPITVTWTPAGVGAPAPSVEIASLAFLSAVPL